MTTETILTKEYLCNLFEYSKGSLYRKVRAANCVYEGDKAGFTRKLIGLFKDLELAELVAVEAKDKYRGEWSCNG